VTNKPAVATSNDNRANVAAAGDSFASRLQRFFRR
jgi:hypothetical protein